jgi:hypothetical protein
MDESERLQRWKEKHFDSEWAEEINIGLSDRIAKLLNHNKIDKYCMVDAYYYDFSVIPREVKKKLNLWRDVYLIFGITTEGEMITKWVDRWDLDNTDPIVDGKVIPQERKEFILPEIRVMFDPKLLSTPAPDFIKMFGKPDV